MISALKRAALIAALLPALASGADPLQAALAGGLSRDLTPMVQAFLFLSALSFLPLLLIAITGFTRVIIVLGFVRTALGLQQTPPNSVLITLGIFLTLFVMTPVLDAARKDALDPYLAGRIAAPVALERGFEPFKAFMVRQTREQDLAVVLEMAKVPPPESMAEIRATHLIPAFMLSELRTAFTIGFVIFLPFLLIDLVVAAILMSLGMIMVPPATVSLPLKIMLFLMIDGWALVGRTLLASFGG